MKKIFFYFSAAALLIAGCGKDDNSDELKSDVTVGLFVLSEGDWNVGNGQLVYFDYDATTDRFVRNDAKRFTNFGETPNDLIIYGSKMYAVITGSGSGVGDGMVRVLNISSGETIADIVITKDGVEQQPRRLAASNGKVFVTLYPGAVAEIDTASFNCRVLELAGGTQPEGICVHEQSLYICNSGWGFGNTVSVVNIATFTETATITVAQNPMNIVNVGNGELYFNTSTLSWITGAPANLHALNVNNNTVTTLDVEVDFITAGKNYVYGVGYWDEFVTSLKKINIANKTVSDFTDDASEYGEGSKIFVNPLNNDVFVMNQEQQVWRFKEDGAYVETLTTGAKSGAAIVFINVVK